jgi:hypothetical protein
VSAAGGAQGNALNDGPLASRMLWIDELQRELGAAGIVA